MNRRYIFGVRIPIIIALSVAAMSILLTGWFAVTQPIFPIKPVSNTVIVNPAHLQTHVQTLSQTFFPRDYRHVENLDRAAAYIRKELEKAGGIMTEQAYQAEFDPTHDSAWFVEKPGSPQKTYRNVIASFGPDTVERIIVGAHYDSFGELPAADDNASGVAGLIELAYLLGKTSLPMRVELVAYTLEEPMTPDGRGLFRTVGGSAVHAASLKSHGIRVRMMLSLEMIGYFTDKADSQSYPSWLFKTTYPSRGDFIMVIGRPQDGWLARSLKKTMRSASILPVYSLNAPASLEGVDWSDHSNYWKQGYPALMVTDVLPKRSMNYHKETDTPAVLDYKRMSMVVQGIYAAVLEVAETASKESQ